MSHQKAHFIKAMAKDGATYAPNHVANEIGDIAIDKSSGGLLCHISDLESSKDSVSTVPYQSGTATLTFVASTAASQAIVGANAARKGLILGNNDANNCYIKFGSTASASSFSVVLATMTTYQATGAVWTGQIDAIWSADGAGGLACTEIT